MEEQHEFTNEIYIHLKVSQWKKRPDKSYLKTTQYNISPKNREEAINRLVVLSEHFNLVPETIYSAVGYLDLYLSGYMAQGMDELLLVALSSFFLAAKYHEQPFRPSIQLICQIFYFFYDGKYDLCEFTNEEVLQMEKDIVRFLNFQLALPTAKDFLQIFVPDVIANEMVGDFLVENAFSFRCLADYIAELHLLDYSMICFMPSMVAASAVFLAKFILKPYWNPWNTALWEVTEYLPSDLKGCIEALHSLYCKNYKDVKASAIREKYSRREYCSVANIGCPENIPAEYF
ncbi:hypothetical protein Leryth_024469 [Lithospermum erythrorhizon]|nr:hypothetical protein Leryth_024469 [Lithospermum erythrorhizon]